MTIMKLVARYMAIYVHIITVVVVVVVFGQFDTSISTEGLGEYGNAFPVNNDNAQMNELNGGVNIDKTSGNGRMNSINSFVNSYNRVEQTGGGGGGAVSAPISASKASGGFTQTSDASQSEDTSEVDPPDNDDEFSRNAVGGDMIAPPVAATNSISPEGITKTFQSTRRGVHRTFQYGNDGNILSQMRKNDGYARNFKEGASDDESIASLLKSFQTDDQAGNPYHLGVHGDFGVMKTDGTEKELQL